MQRLSIVLLVVFAFSVGCSKDNTKAKHSSATKRDTETKQLTEDEAIEWIESRGGRVVRDDALGFPAFVGRWVRDETDRVT